MNTKTLNRFSSIINLICVITFGLFFISDIIMADYRFFPIETSIGMFITILFSISALGLIIIFSINTIINIVLAVQNRRDKKLFITYLFFAISEIIFIIMDIYTLNDNILLFDDLLSLDLYVGEHIFEIIPIIIATIMLGLQFIFIHKQDNDNIKNKKYLNKMFNIIIIIFLIITCIIRIVLFVIYSKENFSIDKYINDIEKQIKENCPLKTEERYFTVCENGKWGYINDKGQNIIPCIYDYAFEFYEVGFNFNNEYLVSIVIKNNDYLLIFPNKNTINLGNNPLKQYEGRYTPLERITKELFLFCYEAINNRVICY